MIRFFRTLGAAAVAAGILSASLAHAQETKRAGVSRAHSEISVDGVLNEQDWLDVPSIGEILQREPKQGQPASERTEVRLLYDRNNFYVGVTCYESEAGSIIATQMARDGDLSADDKI